MYLSDEQWDEMVERINRRAGKPCPLCGEGHLAVGRLVFEMRPFAFGSASLEGPILPVIPAECTSCGYTVLFNAVSLGVVPLDEDGEVS